MHNPTLYRLILRHHVVLIICLFLSGCVVFDKNESIEYQSTATAEDRPLVSEITSSTSKRETATPSPTPSSTDTPSPTDKPSPVPSPTPAHTKTPEASSTPMITPTVPTVWSVDGAAGIPSIFMQDAARGDLFVQDTDKGAQADLYFRPSDENQVGVWQYAVVAPFFTVQDGISLDDLQTRWIDGELLVSAETAEILSAWWELPTPDGVIVPADTLAEAMWATPQWAIVPFERLQSDLKVISVDGLSPLSNFNADKEALEAYPLGIPIGITGDEAAIELLLSYWQPVSNRNPALMTRIAMTGVTALVRATADEMEINGILWPGEVISDVMNAADIAHMSNEIPFAEDCPPPDRNSTQLVFCSSPRYFALLESLGIDVVEVTGNHSNDYGTEAFIKSLSMYEDAGMQAFGGGRDLTSARQAALFEHHGNKIAFVGCNPVGPAYSWATDELPGTRPCDETMQSQIGQLAADGYTVISTFQYHEFYSYEPTIQQQIDFREMVDAGAAVVNGSQGHHAAGFDFYKGKLIHYGLGNLFFDQMFSLGTRQTFIDQLIIYDNRVISAELSTYLIENYARPREMNAAEREQMLTSVFAASRR